MANIRIVVFKDVTLLEEMLSLRRQGWSLKQLAFKYHCDHSSIKKQCKKAGIPNRVALIPFVRVVRTRIRFKRDWNGERIATGKSYAQYLAEERERKERAFANMIREQAGKPLLPV